MPLHFAINEDLTPAFEKGEAVIYTPPFEDYDHPYLRKNHLRENPTCYIIRCCISEYEAKIIDGRLSTRREDTDGDQWCFVSVPTPTADVGNDKVYIRARY